MPLAPPISDFRGGLDTRKISLALPAGTLIQCNNAHINQGGEIEKRKAFVQLGGAQIPLVSTFPTFGQCSTPAGIALFGSGNITTGVAPTAAQLANFVSPTYYVMVTHPAVLAGVAYSQGSHALTAIVCTQLFGAFPLCVGTFADGNSYPYYNGNLISDFTAGVVLNYMTTGTTLQNETALAAALAGLVNNTNNYTATPSGAVVDNFSLPGASYNATVEVLSGNITVSTNSNINYATGTVTNDTGNNPPDGAKVTIGAQIYRFKAAMTTAFDVQIGTTSVVTLKNLFLAINASGVAGTNYFAGTTASTTVKASAFVSTPDPTFTLTSKTLLLNGVTQNTIPGVSLIDENNSSFATVYGTPSMGQFTITAVGLASTFATGSIINDGTNVSDNDTATINGRAYRFKTTPVALYDVKIGASASVSIQNLVLAINNAGGSGNYFPGIVASLYVTAAYSGISNPTANLTAITPGTAANAYTLAKSAAHLSVSGATLSGGTASSAITQIYVGPLSAYGLITTNGINPANNSTLTIGAITYTFVTTLVAAPANSILIGITVQDTLQNLIDSVNGTGLFGTNNLGGIENQQVSAITTTQGGAVVLVARISGSVGNAIALSTTGSIGLTVPATLTNGVGAINSPTAGQTLLAAPVLCPTGQSAPTFAALVASAINANTGTSGFNAFIKGQTVYLLSNVYGSYDNNAAVTVVSAGVAIGVGGFNFTLLKTGGGTIGQIQLDGNNLMTSASPLALLSQSPANMTQLVFAVASNINGNTAATTEPNGSGGFLVVNQFVTAVAVGNSLYLSKITTTSSDFPLTTSATTDGTYIVSSQVGPAGLTATIPAFLNIANGGQASATCQASGGYPPYSYDWQPEAGSDPTLGLQILTNGLSSANFQINATSANPHVYVTCTVSDAQGNSVVSNFLIVGKY